MADRVLQRRDTSANWSSANPILAEGEMGIVTDTKGYKIGDGSTAWNDLEYPSNPTTVANELGNSTTTAISQKITTDSILNKLDITNIDLDSSIISKLMFATVPTRYNVMSNNKNCGILEVFSDNNGHMLTEVFETHYIVEDGVLTSGHSDDKIFRYKREYHYDGGTSTIPVGTWGEWEMIYSSDNQNDIDTLKNDVENLNANTGISEYETFSDQKAYSAGDIVKYNGLLYTFTTDHVAGAWDESHVKSYSLNKIINNNCNRHVYTNNKLANAFFINLFIDKTNYTGDIDISNIEVRTLTRNMGGVWLFSFQDKETKTLLATISTNTETQTNFSRSSSNGLYIKATVDWSVLEENIANSVNGLLLPSAFIDSFAITDAKLNATANILSNIVREDYILQIEPENIDSGKYIDLYGNIQENSFYSVAKLLIEENKQYYVSAHISGRNTAMLSFYDVNDKFIDNSYPGTVTDTFYEKVFIEAPVNAKTVRITFANKFTFELYSVTDTSISQKDTSKKLEELENIIDNNNIESISFSNSETAIEINEGYFYKYDTGEIVENSFYKASLFSVNKANKYYATVKSLLGVSTARAVFFNADREYLGYQDKPSDRDENIGGTNIYLNFKDYDVAYVGLTSPVNETPLLCIGISDYLINSKRVYDGNSNKTLDNIIKNGIISPLTNKRIASVGDSITAGAAADKISTDDIENYPLNSNGKNEYKTFMYYIAKYNNAKWFNYGISGSTLGDCYAEGSDKQGFAKENGRYTQMDDNLDYIMIMFGTNDYAYGAYMLAEEYVKSSNGGTYHKWCRSEDLIGQEGYMTQNEYDSVINYRGMINEEEYTGMSYFRHKYLGSINDETNKTWYGSWNIILQHLIKKYPLAKILIWTNPTNTFFDESIKEISKKWGVVYFDIKETNNPLFWMLSETPNGKIDGNTITNYRKSIYTEDGTHPNNDGYLYLYPIIESKLKSI